MNSPIHRARAARATTPPSSALTRRRLLQGSAALAAGAVGAGALSSCGSASGPAGSTEIDYWLWDANQLPAYSAAIDRFMEENPDVFVRVTQLGWDDYWTKLTASFVAEAGPDAFADHLARYPEFLKLGVIAPLDGLAPLDALPAEHFQDGLQERVDWTGRQAVRAAQGLRHDRRHVRQEVARGGGGWPPRISRAWTGIPRTAAASRRCSPAWRWTRTVCAVTRRASTPRTWPATGWRQTPRSTTRASPQLVRLRPVHRLDVHGCGHLGNPIQLRRRALRRDHGLVLRSRGQGPVPTLRRLRRFQPGPDPAAVGKAALALAGGSWMITTFNNMEGMELGIAPLPSGPIGTPVSMFNGLGTRSPHSRTRRRRRPA